MEVVVGTYEELILGYRLQKSGEVYNFELSFTNHSHAGSIKTLATSRKGILATGSTDEVIRLFNLKRRSEIGALMHHNGGITCLLFYKSHMFSSSVDGNIGIWHVGRWECLRTLRGHKGTVNSVSVHPTGKMALSVGHDRTLRVWNLMTGKCAFVKNIKQVADHIKWSPSGSTYVVVMNKTFDIYDMATAEVTHTIDSSGRINCIEYLKENIIILGGEEGKLYIYDIKAKKCLLDFSTNTNRIKGFCWHHDPDDPDALLLVTASSDGFIKAWLLNQAQDETYDISAIAEMQTKFRIICCTIYSCLEDRQKSNSGELTEEQKQRTEQSDTSDHSDGEDSIQEEMVTESMSSSCQKILSKFKRKKVVVEKDTQIKLKKKRKI